MWHDPRHKEWRQSNSLRHVRRRLISLRSRGSGGPALCKHARLSLLPDAHDAQFLSLLDALPHALSLKISVRTISETSISYLGEGAAALGRVLRGNAAITSVNLSMNALGDGGALALAAALSAAASRDAEARTLTVELRLLCTELFDAETEREAALLKNFQKVREGKEALRKGKT